MAEHSDPNYVGSKEGLEAQHKHERELQIQKQQMEEATKKKDRESARKIAWLTAGLGLVGAILTGVITILGGYIQAIHKSSDAAKIEISQKTDLNPLKGFFDGAGAILHALANRSLAPDVQPATSIPMPAPQVQVPAQVPQIQSSTQTARPPIADDSAASQGEMCSTGTKDWAIMPEAAVPQRNGDSGSYTIDFRLKNKSGGDAYFTWVDQPTVTDDAGNRLNVYPSTPGARGGAGGVKVAAGEESDFSVSSSPTRTPLGDHIRLFNINLVVTPVDVQQQSSKKSDELSVGCHDIPVQKLASAAPVARP